MNRKKRIESILKNNLKAWSLDIIDSSLEHSGHHNFDGTQESHFRIILKNNSKIKESRLKIHQKINSLLKDEFVNGLHSIEIKIEN